MTDKDWETGLNLYNAYQGGQHIDTQYQRATDALQQEKQTSLEFLMKS
ncbi:MAG: hypothetical protein ACOCWI_04205 [Bacillota bacterium]